MLMGVSSSLFANNNIEQGSLGAEIARLASSSPIMAIVEQNDNAIAVGDRGHILRYIGDEWLQMSSPTDVLLTNVTVNQQGQTWAVGHDGVIIFSADGGTTWVTQQYLPSTDRPLLDILFSDQDNGIAIGAYGMYFSTSDGGQSWHKQFLATLLAEEDIEYLDEIRAESESEYQYEITSILPHFNDITQLDQQTLLMVGELGLIAKSLDFGKTWLRLPNIYDGSFFSALSTTNKTLLIGGLRGNLFRSVDNGINWQKIVIDAPFSINQIKQLANGDIIIAQNNGILLRSTDDGVNFKQVEVLKGLDIVTMSDVDGQIWLGTSKGLIRLAHNKNQK